MKSSCGAFACAAVYAASSVAAAADNTGQGLSSLYLTPEIFMMHFDLPDTARGSWHTPEGKVDMSSDFDEFAPMYGVVAGVRTFWGGLPVRIELHGFHADFDSRSRAQHTTGGFGAYAISSVQSGGIAASGSVEIDQDWVSIDQRSRVEGAPAQAEQWVFATYPTNIDISQDIGIDTGNVLYRASDSQEEEATGSAVSSSVTTSGYGLLFLGSADSLSVTNAYRTDLAYWGIEPRVAIDAYRGSHVTITPFAGPAYRNLDQTTVSTASLTAEVDEFPRAASLDAQLSESFKTSYLGGIAGLQLSGSRMGYSFSLALSGGVLDARTRFRAREAFEVVHVRADEDEWLGEWSGRSALSETFGETAYLGRADVEFATSIGPGILSVGGRVEYLSAVPVGVDRGVLISSGASSDSQVASGEINGETRRSVKYGDMLSYGMKVGYTIPF